MAIYRNVQLSFWTDNKIEDDFTPEDKFFYLYLLTNPQTNICGCYEVSYNQMCNQTGYNKDTINKLLDRFENVHKMIKYSKDTKEILILNWHKYNWSNSKDTIKGVLKVAEHIKYKPFKDYVKRVLTGSATPPIDPLEASVSDTDTVSDSISDTVKNIINYLNTVCNTNYKYTTQKTRKCISARLNDGFTEQDFYVVIDKKSKEWMGTDMEMYLRPDTLFGTKFEGYLNQRIIKSKGNEKKYIDWDKV